MLTQTKSNIIKNLFHHMIVLTERKGIKINHFMRLDAITPAVLERIAA